MLQPRHFESIAQTLRDVRPNPEIHHQSGAMAQWIATVLRFADMSAQSNPRFNRERFLLAAGAYDAEPR